jgi:hypothetical protein
MTDKLQDIFQRQAAYMYSLRPTYLHNNFQQLLQPWPWDLNGRKSQEEFRLLAWRFTEEIFEAARHYEIDLDPEGQREELADALHFLIELCLVTGVEPAELLTGNPLARWQYDKDSLEEFFDQTKKGAEFSPLDYPCPFYECVRSIGTAMMLLKMRPWRKDYRPTNRAAWVLGMHYVLRSFVLLCCFLNISAADIHAAYFAKGKINDKRVEDFGV